MPQLWSPKIYRNFQGDLVAKGIIAKDEKDRWPDGRYIYTSVIKDRGRDFIQTLNTRYELMGEWQGPWWKRDKDNVLICHQFPVNHT